MNSNIICEPKSNDVNLGTKYHRLPVSFWVRLFKMSSNRLPWWAHKALERIVFGKIRPNVLETICGQVSQEEYVDRNGSTIGFWSCGSYDPSLPYQG